MICERIVSPGIRANKAIDAEILSQVEMRHNDRIANEMLAANPTSVKIAELRPFSNFHFASGELKVCAVSKWFGIAQHAGNIWRTVFCLPEELFYVAFDLQTGLINQASTLVQVRNEDRRWPNWRVPKKSMWIKIPAGKFFMGSNPREDPDSMADERPKHKVSIPYDYWIGRFPVTLRQFQIFIKETKYGWDSSALPDYMFSSPFDIAREMSECKVDFPVTSVNWIDCVAYCSWLNDRLRKREFVPKGYVVRMPTEAEWEKAARGTDSRIFPWGNRWDDNKCNSGETSSDTVKGITVRLQDGREIIEPFGCLTPVGYYNPEGDSPYGCSDMVGNTFEWTSTLYDFSYPYRHNDGREYLFSNARRVVRGGSYTSGGMTARVTYRARRLCDGQYRSNALGFRVVLSILREPLADGYDE